MLSYLWTTKELTTLFCFELNCGSIITKSYRITNAFYHKITVIILPPMRSNSEWVAESCNLSNLSLSPQSLAHTPGSIRVVQVIFWIILNGKFVQKLPIFYEGDLYKFTIPHKLFYFNFKSLATKIEHVPSLGFAALCMHKFTLLKDKNKRNASITKNVDLFWINQIQFLLLVTWSSLSQWQCCLGSGYFIC